MSEYEIIRPRRPSWMARMGQSLRGITLGPWNAKDKEIARYFGGWSSSAGVNVDEESSLSYAAVWNAVNLISGDVAKVPLPLYRNLGEGGKEPFRDHRLYELVHDQPNEEMSSFSFRRAVQGQALVWGNGYAEIERDSAGRPAALWPLMSYAVTAYRERGALRYRVAQPSGGTIEFARTDVLHIAGLGTDGVTAYNPIRKALESIGLGIATQRFAAKFYENGAQLGTVVSFPAGTTTNPATRKEAVDALKKRHEGVDKSHRMLVLYEGATVQNLGVEPDKAQFLETRRFNIEEVARWFNIPVHKLKELARSTNNNIEHQGIEYDTDTLQPWFRMWEGELNLKLIPRLERRIQFFEHVTEALTRGDSTAQSELLSRQFSVGAITPNEIRGKYNMNPMTDGSDIWVPSNMMPATLAKQYWVAQIDETNAKAEASRRPPPEPPPQLTPNTEDDQVNALKQELETARRLKQEWEDRCDLLKGAQEATIVSLHNLALEHRTLGAAHDALQQTHHEMGLANTQAIDVLQGFRLTAEQERSAARWAVAELEAKLETTTAALAEATAIFEDSVRQFGTLKDALEALKQQLEAVTQERDAAVVGLADERQLVVTLTADGDMKAREHIEDMQKLDSIRVGAEADRDAALHIADQTKRDLDAAKAEADGLRAVAQDAHDEVQSERERRTAAQEAITLTLEPKAKQLEAEAEVLRTDLARARADIAAELDKQRTQKVVQLAAMRSLWVDTEERLLYREAERARKNQQTPAKLREWIERFYPMHEEAVRQAFQPLVGPWTAITGGAPGLLLDRLVSEHIETSRTALRLVADYDDTDELAANLERTLSRWEHERADAMADALVREWMANA